EEADRVPARADSRSPRALVGPCPAALRRREQAGARALHPARPEPHLRMRGTAMRGPALLALALLVLVGCPVPADRDGTPPTKNLPPPPTTPDARQDVPSPPAVKP